MPKKITIIGTGNMGRAIINSLKKKYRIVASDIDKTKLRRLNVRTVTDNKLAVRDSDIVLLAVKPQNMDIVLDELSGTISRRQLVVSIAAGVTTKKIENKLGNVPVVRVMPNLPLLAGMGMNVLYKGRYAKEKHTALVKKIFSDIGRVTVIKKEFLMDAVTAISGSGPAYVFLFIELLIKAGIALGLNKKAAETLVLQTFKGAIGLLEKTGIPPEQLRRQVTSKKGTTEAAIEIFEKMALYKIIHSAVKSAHNRAGELSK